MRIRMFGTTDVGRVRKANQDSVFFHEHLGIVVVADGIGGRKGGEIASSLAVEGMKNSFLECETLRHEEVTPFLTSSVDQINQRIINRGNQQLEIKGLGTTLNCLLFVGETLYIAHIGDSRTYLYYRGNLWQLTLDHSIEMYVKRGWLPREALETASKSGALVKALGLSEQCEVDVYEIATRPGEIFLTCSDGLTSMVSDRRITALIKANEHRVGQLPQILVHEANRNGGRDNITVVLSEVVKS